MGYQACMQIVATVKPPVPSSIDDRLVFILSKDGDYSVKKAYSRMREEDCNQLSDMQNRRSIWKGIWKRPSILPRIRVFLWKVLHNALPLGAILVHRTSKGNPTCHLCGQEDETMTHMLFHCPFARSYWLTSPAPILTLQLPPQIHLIFEDCLLKGTDEQWVMMANTMWAIWRCRNDCTYGGKPPEKHTFDKYLHAINIETWMSGAKQSMTRGHEGVSHNQHEVQLQFQFSCYLDGSWSGTWQGGIGYLFYKGDSLVTYEARGVSSCCAIQAEAQALLTAMQTAVKKGMLSTMFYTDCQELAKACNSINPPYTQIGELSMKPLKPGECCERTLVFRYLMSVEAKMIWQTSWQNMGE